METGGFLGFTDQSSKIGKFLVNKGRLKKNNNGWHSEKILEIDVGPH